MTSRTWTAIFKNNFTHQRREWQWGFKIKQNEVVLLIKLKNSKARDFIDESAARVARYIFNRSWWIYFRGK